jgi:hypothetical protein
VIVSVGVGFGTGVFVGLEVGLEVGLVVLVGLGVGVGATSAPEPVLVTLPKTIGLSCLIRSNNTCAFS